LSGDYKGHDEVVGFFKHTLALCGGIFAIEVHHVLAEEDVMVVLVTVAFPEVHQTSNCANSSNTECLPQVSGFTFVINPSMAMLLRSPGFQFTFHKTFHRHPIGAALSLAVKKLCVGSA